MTWAWRRVRAAHVVTGAALLAAAGGSVAALHYGLAGLTLSHYDARGHLVVARRIFDSLTPGWQQIGAVWLPLPHVLNAVPVQFDPFYRTGASAVVISVLSFALAAAAIARIVATITGSALAAAAAALVFGLNPSVVYLQATPMTEPLLIGLITTGIALLIDWCRRPGRLQTFAGVAFALACLTRYEAWPAVASALAIAMWARRRAGDAWPTAAHAVLGIAVWPGAAIVGFLVFSRIVVGQWFVASGFFVPENEALGNPAAAVGQVLWAAGELSGPLTVAVSIAGAVAIVSVAATDRARAPAAVALALGAVAVLPALAFFEGHPFRIRYMVPLVAALAVGAGTTAGLGHIVRAPATAGRLLRVLLPAAVIAIAAIELHPLDPSAPMVVEAQWDRPNAAERRRVTNCLLAGYNGDTVMASMGSLGHYMQELSIAGFDIRDFLHEGNGDIWLTALYDAEPFAGWVLIEESAEGGDMLAEIARSNDHLLKGFTRVCAGGGVALYRRDAPRTPFAE